MAAARNHRISHRKKTRRKRISGDARQAAIVAAAAQLFAERGFNGSTREIATRLGVTQALLYRYFPAKQNLVKAVFASFREDWDKSRAAVLADTARPLADRITDFYAAYIRRHSGFSGVRLFMHAALAGIDLPLRYSPDLDALVLHPVLASLRAEIGRRPPSSPMPRRERDLVLGLHGAIIFVGIRRHIYGAKITNARQIELVGGIIRAWLPGALEYLKLSCDN